MILTKQKDQQSKAYDNKSSSNLINLRIIYKSTVVVKEHLHTHTHTNFKETFSPDWLFFI